VTRSDKIDLIAHQNLTTFYTFAKVASTQNFDHLCKFLYSFDEVYRNILVYEEQEINKVK